MFGFKLHARVRVVEGKTQQDLKFRSPHEWAALRGPRDEVRGCFPEYEENISFLASAIKVCGRITFESKSESCLVGLGRSGAASGTRSGSRTVPIPVPPEPGAQYPVHGHGHFSVSVCRSATRRGARGQSR